MGDAALPHNTAAALGVLVAGDRCEVASYRHGEMRVKRSIRSPDAALERGDRDYGPGSSVSAPILFSSFAASSAPGSAFFCSVMFGHVSVLPACALM